MKFSPLGSSQIDVSRVCLGSMTWGQQNTQKDADEQIEYAMSRGVNFIDTAEMYPVPPQQATYGGTEAIIGDWLGRNTNKRKDIVLATKVAGPGFHYIRDNTKLDGASVLAAVDDSLKRLKTDYIDLYQLHWPNRSTPHFGKHLPNKVTFTDVDAKQQSNDMLEILQALQECVLAGKIRHCGLSDETTWGINEYIRLSEKHAVPRMVSIQNEFNLLHAKDWPYLIENCVHQDIAYLPWSPLAGGMLSGKYLGGARPTGSRWTMTQRNGLFRDTPASESAIEHYVDIAKQWQMTPSQLALLWCDNVNGVTSTIIGATSIKQLSEDIDAFDSVWSEDLASQITRVFSQYPAPF